MADTPITDFVVLTNPQPEDSMHVIDDSETGRKNKELGFGTFLKTYKRSPGEIGASLSNDDIDFKEDEGDVIRYGADRTGAASSAIAFQAAFDQAHDSATGASPRIREGTYLIDEKITVTQTGGSDTERIRIHGEGRKSIINSTVVGDSTFELIDAVGIIIERLAFTGNNLTGASGNGHAIALRDAAPASGTLFPSSSLVQDCFFDGFRGDDTEVTDTTTGVATTCAAVYMGPGNGIYVRRNNIVRCGIGIFFDELENSHAKDNIISLCDEWGILFDKVGDECSAKDNDIIECGIDGNGDPITYSGVLNFSGILVENCTIDPVNIISNKFKIGQAITISNSSAVDFSNNYVRVDPPSTGSSVAVQVDTVERFKYTYNTFEYLDNATTTDRSAVSIDSQAALPLVVISRGNQYIHSHDVLFDLKIAGSSNPNSSAIVDITGNFHGSGRNGRSDATVTDCILFADCNIHGVIEANEFAASGTITDCLDIGSAGFSLHNFSLSGNKSQIIGGGTLTNPIEDVQDASEIVTATNVIVPLESVKTFYLDAVGGFTSTLPAPAPDLKFRFIVKTAPTTAYIITTNSGANILFGTVNEITTTAGVTIQAQDTLNFVASVAIIGDWVEFESDGTNWFVHGAVQVDNAVTVSVT